MNKQPKPVDAERVIVWMKHTMIRAIEEYRRGEIDIPNKSEAIRELIEEGLRAKAERKAYDES